jgi:hypothetical protein
MEVLLEQSNSPYKDIFAGVAATIKSFVTNEAFKSVQAETKKIVKALTGEAILGDGPNPSKVPTAGSPLYDLVNLEGIGTETAEERKNPGADVQQLTFNVELQQANSATHPHPHPPPAPTASTTQGAKLLDDTEGLLGNLGDDLLSQPKSLSMLPPAQTLGQVSAMGGLGSAAGLDVAFKPAFKPASKPTSGSGSGSPSAFPFLAKEAPAPAKASAPSLLTQFDVHRPGKAESIPFSLDITGPGIVAFDSI